MGKTVTTYLIDGDPKGTQYVFISNKICQMYVIPRSNLSILNERQELQTPAFYILLGEDEATKPKASSCPSTAADFCIGSSNNGWLVWKDKDGQTLDAVYRKQLE
ncbi:MAG: DUF4357 domain-containing protein [Prevotella sp.]|nr:DUF4357 domain-containing protein [Prevotella sp.]